MPPCDSAAPRNMLPPPTTAATWMPSWAAAETSFAMCTTASGEIPSGSPPANASPESFSTTRCQLGCASPAMAAPSAAAVVAPFRRVVPSCTGASFRGLGWPPARSCAGSAGLSDLEPGKPPHAGAMLRQQPLDRLLLVPDGGLLDQHDVLQERVHAALHDLGDRLLRFPLLAGHLLGDPALVRHHVRWHVVAGHVARAHGRDLVRDVLADLGGCRVQLDQHAEGRRQPGVRLVQVAGDIAAREPGEPAHLDLLLERGPRLLDQFLGRLARPDFQAEHGQPVPGARRQRRLGDVGRYLLEQLGLRDEIGLAVYLEEHTIAVPLHRCRDQAISCGPLGPLRDVLRAFDAQDLYRALVIRGLHQGVPAIKHTRARLLAEPLHIRRAVLHVVISHYLVVGSISSGSDQPGTSPSGPLGQAGSPAAGSASSASGPETSAPEPFAGTAPPADTASAAGSALAGGSAFASGLSARSPRGGPAGVPFAAASVAVSPPAPAPAASAPSADLPSSSARSHSASGSSAPRTPSAGGAGFSSPAAAPARAIRPSATASATTLVSSATLRIASSFPGIG